MVARHDQTTDPELLAALLQARRGTAFFARKLNELTDAELDGDSLLPGWTRRHITAHIGYNARAIARLIEWAATGVETPMYASTEVRDHEIDFGATLSPIALRHLFDHSAVHLNVEWRDLPGDAWHHKVRTIQGREVPATETVWMRSREVWMHAVDLDNGASLRRHPGTGAGTAPEGHHRRLAHPRHRQGPRGQSHGPRPRRSGTRRRRPPPWSPDRWRPSSNGPPAAATAASPPPGPALKRNRRDGSGRAEVDLSTG